MAKNNDACENCVYCNIEHAQGATNCYCKIKKRYMSFFDNIDTCNEFMSIKHEEDNKMEVRT